MNQYFPQFKRYSEPLVSSLVANSKFVPHRGGFAEVRIAGRFLVCVDGQGKYHVFWKNSSCDKIKGLCTSLSKPAIKGTAILVSDQNSHTYQYDSNYMIPYKQKIDIKSSAFSLLLTKTWDSNKIQPLRQELPQNSICITCNGKFVYFDNQNYIHYLGCMSSGILLLQTDDDGQLINQKKGLYAHKDRYSMWTVGLYAFHKFKIYLPDSIRFQTIDQVSLSPVRKQLRRQIQETTISLRLPEAVFLQQQITYSQTISWKLDCDVASLVCSDPVFEQITMSTYSVEICQNQVFCQD